MSAAEPLCKACGAPIPPPAAQDQVALGSTAAQPAVGGTSTASRGCHRAGAHRGAAPLTPFLREARFTAREKRRAAPLTEPIFDEVKSCRHLPACR